tara:strand:- start:696 stop:1286 length:591 start_codon:yes stop_codon:yes gene_type:complete
MFKDKQTYVVVDVETGGLDAEQHSILEISGILWKPGRSPEPLFDTYVHEDEITCVPRAMEINQIDLNKVKELGKTPSEAVSYIKKKLNAALGESRRAVKIIAHNSNFDYSFLKRLYKLANEDIRQDFYGRTIDSASILEFLMLINHINGDRASADVLFESTNNQLKEEERHRSYYDALATAKSMEALFNVYFTQGE